MMCVKKERSSTSSVFPGRKLNFLLVDDDDVCLFIHRRVLEICGYCASTHSAANGKSALAILETAAKGAIPFPDIILLDLEMPIMNGLAFMEAFQALPYGKKDNIAIVLLSSSVSEKDKDYARSLGAAHCLSKPLTQEILDSAVRDLYKDQGHL